MRGGRPASLAGIWSMALSAGPLQTLLSSPRFLPSFPGPPIPPLEILLPRQQTGRAPPMVLDERPCPDSPSCWATWNLARRDGDPYREQLPFTEHDLPTKHFTHLSFTLPTTLREASISPTGADIITPLYRRGNRGTEWSGTCPSSDEQQSPDLDPECRRSSARCLPIRGLCDA